VRVLLVFPRFRYPSGDPPLGVAYLASVLRREGADVSIFDCTWQRHPLAELSGLLQETPYDLIGISALTSMLRQTADIARLAKEVSPESLVLVGGPHATVEPESTLLLPGVDAVAIGEAETTVSELLRTGLDPEGVPGLWHRAEDEIVRGPEARLVEDLDTLPLPAWDLLDMRRYVALWYHLDAVRYGLRGTSIMASRGCPFRCAYCQPTLEMLFGRRVRRRSPQSLIAEMIELRGRFGIDGLMWLDDTFLLDREWMRDFCAHVIEARVGLIWGANMRADVADEETLSLMKEAGLRIIHLGIESASQRVLDEVYQKGISLEQVRETVSLGKRLGLCVRGYFMLGAPTETLEEAEETIRLACTLDLDDVTFSITTPLPHTHLYDLSREHITADFSDFDYYKRAVYDSEEVIPARVLDRLRKRGYVRFYVGRRRFLRTVRSVLGVSGLRKTLLKLQRF
jgi:anaerobic magnesium-protoporphyrin IX monomethyl ester cyclase